MCKNLTALQYIPIYVKKKKYFSLVAGSVYSHLTPN